MLWAGRVLARAVAAVWELLSRLRRRPVAADPAEALRRRLAEARARDTETAPVAIETVPAEVETAPLREPDQVPGEPVSTDLEDLRRNVHARGRALSDEMRDVGERD